MIAIDIPMPKTCDECPCWCAEFCDCQITNTDTVVVNVGDDYIWEPIYQKPSDCPLIEYDDKTKEALRHANKINAVMMRQVAELRSRIEELEKQLHEKQRSI